MSTPASTIAVVPREAFSSMPLMLDRLLAHTPEPRRIVVVDGGSPGGIRRRIESLAAAHDLTLIRHEAVLAANEARNLAAAHVTTEFVVFVDNDTLVDAGWLEGLERCARETGAAVVSPVVLWGASGLESVHFAGGECHIADGPGGRRLVSHNARMSQPVDVVATLSRHQSELTELHCTLVRTDVLTALGPFDEDFIAGREEADLSLGVAAGGHTIVVEPAVIVGYPAPKQLARCDRRYFRARWSDAWARRSFRAFNAKWGLGDTQIDDQFLEGHVVRRIGPWPGWTDRGGRAALAWKARRARDAVATPLAARAEDRRRARVGPPVVVYRASWDVGVGRSPARPEPDGSLAVPPTDA